MKSKISGKSASKSDLNSELKKEAMELFNIGSAKKSEIIGDTHVRMLTLKQLKDVIHDIYEHKEKHDEKCRKGKLPLETMEQFMFTYLNQKYGLKNLIIEWAASIVNGVKFHMKEDSDVALFAKLLKNEVEEDFRYIQDKVKTTISKVLKKYLKEKFKNKPESDISDMQEKFEGGFITNQMCDYILDFIYEQGDKERIKTMIQDRKKLNLASENLYQNRGRNVTPPKYAYANTKDTTSPLSYKTRDLTPKNRPKGKNKQSTANLKDDGGSNERQEEIYQRMLQERDSTKVSFKDLLFWICDFQMIQHEKYLSRFVSLFKSVDSNRDGIISEDQFKSLIREMKIIPNSDEQGEMDIEKLLIMIDPHKTQQITFSELVTFLTLTELNDSTPNRDLDGQTEENTSNLLESFTNYNDGEPK